MLRCQLERRIFYPDDVSMGDAYMPYDYDDASHLPCVFNCTFLNPSFSEHFGFSKCISPAIKYVYDRPHLLPFALHTIILIITTQT